MEAVRLKIENFRGIKNGEIYFNGHTLLIGGNNSGKSTICEALDLVLSSERLGRKPVINEHDFYQSQYLDDKENEIKIKIEVVLIELSKEVKNQFRSNIEYWDTVNKKLLNQKNKAEDTDKTSNIPALRVFFEGWYNKEEDDFEGKTFFANPLQEDEIPVSFSRTHKKEMGYLYLRALRTGRRALSLERGSLLDRLLRFNEEAPLKMWKETINNLEGLQPPIHEIVQLKEILSKIKDRMKKFINLSEDHPLSLYVSRLTREHLRGIITLFVASKHSSKLVPYYNMGSGTINAFVFSLLSFIAESKKNVIFAMEEPEIAIPPHTQRRLIRFCLKKMDQFLVTSHSPYVIERFDPKNIVLLQRKSDGSLNGKSVELKGLKLKNFQRRLRKQLAEAILGEGVLIVEGKTEEDIFPVASSILEEKEKNYRSFDLKGITVISADGEGNLIQLGKFFKSLNLKCYTFFDKQKNQDQLEKINQIFDKSYEIPQAGIEQFLIDNIDSDIQREFIEELKKIYPKNEDISLIGESSTEEDVKKATLKLLKSKKGDGCSAKLVSLSVPEYIKKILMEINEDILTRDE